MLKTLLSNILILSLLFLISCGDLKSKKENEVKIRSLIQCELDSSAFTQILRKRIQGELNCLESSLQLFVNIVETDAPGNLSESHLKTFIRANVPAIEERTISALSAIFDLSRVLFGDKKGYIKRENIGELISLLKEINAVFVDNNVHEFFTTDEKIDFNEHDRRKTIIYNSLRVIGQSLNKRMKANGNSINLKELVDYFKGTKTDEFLEDVKTIFFIKKAIIGGEAEVLSFQDMNRLSLVLKDMSKIIYDFVKILDVEDAQNDEVIISILKEDVQTVLGNFFYKDQPDEEILSYEGLVTVLETFIPSFSKYLKYEESIFRVKEILLGNSSHVFTAGDFNNLFEDIFLTNLERGQIFYRSYRENSKDLDSANAVEGDFRNSYLIGKNQNEYQEDFNRIVSNYRFFKGSRNLPQFGFDYARNRRAILEIALFEDVVERTFKFYGSPKENTSEEYVLNIEQLKTILNEFKPLLVDSGIIHPDRVISTSNTITLMTSLFHHQSNGDSSIDVPEFVEFILTVMSSLNLSENTYTQMKGSCFVDQDGKYDPNCFRANFLRSILEESPEAENTESVTSAESVPELVNYLEGLNQVDTSSYLSKVASFSRTCSFFKDGTEVPMTKGDGLSIWAGLLAIEQTMLRYDLNTDGILDAKELIPLYDTFRPALEAILPNNYLKKRSFKVFQYIVKFKGIPEVSKIKGPSSLWRAVKAGSKFAKFMYFTLGKNRESSADRLTFAAVLKLIQEKTPVEEGAEFDCELLR